jgi:hypothetical protein
MKMKFQFKSKSFYVLVTILILFLFCFSASIPHNTDVASRENRHLNISLVKEGIRLPQTAGVSMDRGVGEVEPIQHARIRFSVDYYNILLEETYKYLGTE